MGEVPGDSLGDEWKGYVFRIGGGNDKQGFPMMQGVLTNGRVRLLLGAQHSCYRPRRTGQRHRRSVRGCIVDANLSVLHLIIIKKGEAEIPGLTDTTIPRRLGPKRAGKIRKLFNLTKDDDVRQYVVRRPIKLREGQEKPKSALVSPRQKPTLTSTPSYLLSDRRKRKSGNCLVGVLRLLCANPLRRNPARRAFLSRGKGASNRAGRNMKHQYSRYNFNNKSGQNKGKK